MSIPEKKQVQESTGYYEFDRIQRDVVHYDNRTNYATDLVGFTQIMEERKKIANAVTIIKAAPVFEDIITDEE